MALLSRHVNTPAAMQPSMTCPSHYLTHRRYEDKGCTEEREGAE